MNKITLIIPDLHHRVDQATRIINAVGADEVITLGDYFDDFDDTAEMVKHTCGWLEWFVSKPNHIALMGNHEQGYRYTYKKFKCSGYEEWKYFIIHDNLPREVWDKIKWYHFLDNRWLLSHGGLHRRNLPSSITKFKDDRTKFISEIDGFLQHHIQQGFRDAANNQNAWIFSAGYARFGNIPVGGITWCDYLQEFVPIQGLNQIIGHTPQVKQIKWSNINIKGNWVHPKLHKWTPTPEILDNPKCSTNICLDVHGNTHWAVWDGKTFTVGNYKDL